MADTGTIVCHQGQPLVGYGTGNELHRRRGILAWRRRDLDEALEQILSCKDASRLPKLLREFNRAAREHCDALQAMEGEQACWYHVAVKMDGERY